MDKAERTDNLRFPSFRFIRNETEPVFAPQRNAEFRKCFIVDPGLELTIEGVRGRLPKWVAVDVLNRSVKFIGGQ